MAAYQIIDRLPLSVLSRNPDCRPKPLALLEDPSLRFVGELLEITFRSYAIERRGMSGVKTQTMLDKRVGEEVGRS
jgi:hypothetical protein